MKVIDSEVFIGNILIEVANKNMCEVSIFQVIEIDDLFTNVIKKHGYVPNLSMGKLFDFELNYPYFIKIEDGKIKLNTTDESRLITYFRAGLPREVVKCLRECINTIIK